MAIYIWTMRRIRFVAVVLFFFLSAPGQKPGLTVQNARWKFANDIIRQREIENGFR